MSGATGPLHAYRDDAADRSTAGPSSFAVGAFAASSPRFLGYPEAMPSINLPLRDAPTGVALEVIYDALLGIKNVMDNRLSHLEAQMADLGPSLDRLEQAVRNLNLGGASVALQEALDAERQANARLVAEAAAAESTRVDLAAAEQAEDVQQNAALAAAVSDYQTKVAETDAAATRIDAVADTLEALPGSTDPGSGDPIDPNPPVTDPTLEPTEPPVTDEPAPTPDPSVPVVDPGEPAPGDTTFPPSNQ